MSEETGCKCPKCEKVVLVYSGSATPKKNKEEEDGVVYSDYESRKKNKDKEEEKEDLSRTIVGNVRIPFYCKKKDEFYYA